jgi:hypothetical protein
MPTLRPLADSLRRPFRNNRTPFPDPPRVVTIPGQSDPFEPLDYSPLRNPPRSNIGLLSEVAVAAAALGNDDCDISDEDNHSSKSPTRVAGHKGSLGDDDGEDDDSQNSPSIEDSKDPDYRQSFPDDDELAYSDDEELDASFEEVLDEVARQIEYSDPKTVNHGRRRTTLIAGGPQPPDYAGMNAVEQDLAKAEFQKKRKAYSDKCRRTRLKGNVDLDVLSKGTYSGCLHPTLRPMSDVESNRLLVGHTFPDVHVLQLRVAEEANLRGISFQTVRCEIRQLRCYGYNFAVEANNREYEHGFIVTLCCVRLGDDYTSFLRQKLPNGI